MAKRKGRGYGSGKGGHTSGRGQKGQKSRSHIHILFQGVKVKKSTLKRLPLLRGRGKFAARQKELIIKADELNVFENGAKVDLAALIKKRIVSESDAKKFGVKILMGKEKLTKKLEILVPHSKSLNNDA